ncbi:MAG: AMP-binding protein, partial [FCB group bacterium]|nr:AMP-binding protein [FCB group bacterium]
YVGGVRVLRRLAQLRGSAAGALMPVVFTSLLVAEGGHDDAGEDEEDTVDASGDGVVFGISQTPQVILDHQVSEARGALRFNWDAVEDLFPAAVLDRMFDAYQRLLLELAEAESWRSLALPAVPDADLALQRAANDTAEPLPGGLLHTGFEAFAAAQPAAPAVLGGGFCLSYGELEGRANALARDLEGLGCPPGGLVAVVMEKGWQQVVTVLGILKAGAAYLPVDPELPRERRDYLLTQGRVEIAVTQPRLDAELEWPPALRRVPVGER